LKYRKLGKTGLKISELSLGAWLTYGGSLEQNQSKPCISKAIELGVNFIDIADIYAKGKAEDVVGNILIDYNRNDLVISSKVFWPMSENPNDRGLSRKHIMESIEGTLDRLQTDYVDIYFCHRFDRETPLEETVKAMSDLVDQGLIHYWGTSVWTAAHLERAVGIAKANGYHPPSVEQPRYNMLDRYIELEVMETTTQHGMGIVVWSPLGGGLLTGKYNKTIPEGSRAATTQFVKREIIPENIQKITQLQTIANELNLTTGQLALAWILRRPEISSAITGATKVEHVESNMQASGIVLENEIINRIEEILGNKPKMHPVYLPPW